jgi:SAM-dependent methyltransferase
MDGSARKGKRELDMPRKKARTLFDDEAHQSPSNGNGYEPLPSVWFGTDSALLDRMLTFYPHARPQAILDATVNKGRIWEGLDWDYVGLDIDKKHKPDVVGDNRDMPFEDGSFDVIVYDPPHIPNLGKDGVKDFATRFGLNLKSTSMNGKDCNLNYLFPPFVKEAWRVLKPKGVLLCKIADYVHGHRFQWAHIELVKAAEAVGFTACDCIVKVRKGPIVDPKWKTAHHARRQHCYWLVFRRSTKCE